MTRTAKIVLSVVVPLLLLGALPVLAQDDGQGAMFTGQFMVGYRSVSVDGQNNKYMQDYNLQKGPRLFNLNFVLKPDKQLRGFADRIQLTVNNYGGDPNESMHLGIEKYGAYNFQYSRTKDTYFYNDIILPEDIANSRIEEGGDFRTFNYQHVRDVGRLDISLTKAAKLHFNFDRFTKVGSSTLPMDVAHDGYEFDKPIDESQNRYGVGLDYAWQKVTLSLDENIRDYKNVFDMFLPGASLGANPTNADALNYYFLTQPYDYKSYDHTIRIVAHPSSKLIVKASALLQRLNMDVSASQSQSGINYNGQPLTPMEATGAGSISRDSDLYNLDMTYMVTNKVGIIAGLWHNKLTQNGNFTFASALNQGAWDLKTTGGRAGVEFDLSSQFTLTLGGQYEKRDATEYRTDDGEYTDEGTLSTKNTGFFGTADWVPNTNFRLTAEVEDATYTDPYTLKSPTDRQRLRVRARYNLKKGLYLAGSYLYNKFKNNDSGWDAHYDEANLRLGYQSKAITATVGYGRIDIGRSINHDTYIVDTSTFLFYFPITYDAKTDLYDGSIRWALNKQWAIGGDLRYYKNSGSWGLMSDDYQGYVEYTFTNGYLVHAGYRYIKYNEDQFNYNDYSAKIGEFSIGYRW